MGVLLNENGTRILQEDAARVWLEDAPWLYLRETLTTATVHDSYPEDLLRLGGLSEYLYVFTLTAGGTNIPLVRDGSAGVAWYSERVQALTTLTGLSFRHYATVSAGAATAGTMRVRVWVMGANPEHEETLIVDYLGGSLPVATYTSRQVWSLPLLSSPVTLSPGQRLILRLTAEPLPATTMEDGEITLYVGGLPTGFIQADVALLPEPDLPLHDNVTRVYLRRTTSIGIGTLFDALTTPVEQAPATAVVNTADGVGAPWTQTGGGAPIAWVTPRFSGSWYFTNVTMTVNGSPITIPRVQGIVYAIESNAAAEAAFTVRLYRLRGSVETECAAIRHNSDASGDELPLTYPAFGDITWNVNSGRAVNTVTPCDFQPDDRLVIRLFLRETTTLVSGHTATVSYDGTGTQSYLDLFDTDLGFKAEADPATPPTVPGGDMMGGVGN